jgi:DNA repair protein RecO (recombination protein O)
MSGPFTTEALLLKATDKGEDDRSVVLLTPDHGRVSALAKRARGSRRRFGAALQQFCLFEAALRPKSGGLVFLEAATAKEFPLGSAAGWDSMAAGWLFLDLADALCTAGTAHPAYFELVLGGLRRLGKGLEDSAAVRLSVLWGSLELAGWAPDLRACSGCGSEGPWPDLGLDPARGLLCPDCRATGSPALDQAVLQAWRRAAQGQAQSAPPAAAEQGLLRWAEYHVGRALPSAAMAASPAWGAP